MLRLCQSESPRASPCSRRPHFIVAAAPEESDGDYNVAFEGQSLLRLKKLFLETRAAAECYDFVFADHI